MKCSDAENCNDWENVGSFDSARGYHVAMWVPSSYSNCPIYDETFLIFGKDWDGSQWVHHPIEILNLETGLNCTVSYDPNDYQIPRFPVGGVLDDQYPVYCGGSWHSWDKAADFNPSCYKIFETEPFHEMTVKRYRAAAVLVDSSRLWVTGGINGYPNYLSSTEFVSLDPEKSGPGPDLPKALWCHCLVKIDDTHVMMIGGKSFLNFLKYLDHTSAGAQVKGQCDKSPFRLCTDSAKKLF